MKRVLLFCFLMVLPVSLSAMPTADSKRLPLSGDAVATAPVTVAPLDREAFVWQDSQSVLPYVEANRRLLEGLGRCSQFAVETRVEQGKTTHDIFFRVGENRSPWPIGRIELLQLKQGIRLGFGQNKQFSMGVGKFQKMWAGYLDENYVCPPKPGTHPGGMPHP